MDGALTMESRAAAQLFAELSARGIRVVLDGDRLRIGPPERLDPETLERARAVREALRSIVSTKRTWPCVRCGRHSYPLPAVCYWCRRGEGRPAQA